MNPGAAERIDAKADLRVTNGVHVDHIAEIANVGVKVVVPVGCGGTKSLFQGGPLHLLQSALQILVGLRFDPAGDRGICRAAVRRIVFEASVMGWVVGRRDQYAIGQSARPAAVVRQNRVGDGRCRHIFVPLGDHHFHLVGSQHLQSTGKGRLGKGMRVEAEKQRTIDLRCSR